MCYEMLTPPIESFRYAMTILIVIVFLKRVQETPSSVYFLANFFVAENIVIQRYDAQKTSRLQPYNSGSRGLQFSKTIQVIENHKMRYTLRIISVYV